MESGTSILNSFLGGYGIVLGDIYVFIAAIAAFMTVFIVGNSLIVRNRFQSRIKILQERRKALKDEITGPKRRNKRQQETVNFMRRVVVRFQLLKKGQVHELVNELVTAGIRNKDAIYIFAFFKTLTPIVFLGLALLLTPISLGGDPTIPQWHLLVPILAAYAGLKLPSYYVSKKRKARYYNIQKGLADTLDLLMICAEAGLSLAQGLDRVARELQLPYPDMADELALTSIELSFQPDRQKTLNGLAQRVMLPEIKGIVNVLIQTEKYGTPIAQALRTLSSEFRTQRMLRAEQKAARLPAIMTIPMILFILPTLFIVVIAPAAIDLIMTTN